ncbi:pirin family protein [Nocardioides insulae]|uniref:pirin family protein n=1 Tax=Nocardioides insulae TaxID=394734 RepID=UPI0004290039|nr:pirin family protein [Nocardioides insulae]
MSNTETRPDEIRCETAGGAEIELIAPREVPLGGPRAMTVRRTLPSRSRSLIGAWCFLDHYGPDDVSATGGMKVAPHPHTGLQTVSWLFTGEVEHRDSAGHHARVRPGEVNLMTGGRGISHSEVSDDAFPVLHGAQLWVALPDSARHSEPGFEHHVPTPVTGPGWSVRVLVGSLLGDTSPVHTFTPLVGAEVLLDPGTSLEVPVEPGFEHGVLVDTGALTVHAEGGPTASPVGSDELAYLPPGATRLTFVAGERWTRLLLLGGRPFGESIVMWWNFVGRDHDEILGYRRDWQDQITVDGAVVSDSQLVRAGRYGVVVGDHLPPIPAPPMPQGVRLRERR